jgi:2-C-methyl-D-erythritol 2,4-cyclodiphosphate synthase
MNFRIGFGFDVHQLEKADTLILGGIAIPSQKGAVGHSDADVLIHAICDALLGAAGLRDIGNQFPNTDPTLKGIDSKILLSKTIKLLEDHNYLVGNIDATVCLEQPKINPHIENMRMVLSEILKIESSAVSIKATTNETLGYVGREDGINAYAVALIYKP